jgi:predicted lactoylglutathione lyase
MTDRAVPNLPSRDLSTTAAFYGTFGFVEAHRDEHWMVLRRVLAVLSYLNSDTSP